MADDVITNEDAPTETELLEEISNDIKYMISCIVPNSVYKDFEFPTSDDSDDSDVGGEE